MDVARPVCGNRMRRLYENTTRTLFTSSSPTWAIRPPDGLTPATGSTIRRLVKLAPRTLAVMHGSSYSGAAAPVLESLAGV